MTFALEIEAHGTNVTVKIFATQPVLRAVKTYVLKPRGRRRRVILLM